MENGDFGEMNYHPDFEMIDMDKKKKMFVKMENVDCVEILPKQFSLYSKHHSQIGFRLNDFQSSFRLVGLSDMKPSSFGP